MAADTEAFAYAEERLTRARLFHHYGLDVEARRLLEEALAIAPEHVAARQLLVEACRALGDAEAAAHHLDVLVHVMRRRGEAAVLPSDGPVGLPPVEEWDPEDPGDLEARATRRPGRARGRGVRRPSRGRAR